MTGHYTKKFGRKVNVCELDKNRNILIEMPNFKIKSWCLPKIMNRLIQMM